MKPVLIAALLTLASPGWAQSGRPADCLLVVMGQEVMRETCLFTPLADDGSFMISSMNGKFFAQVLIDRPGQGIAYWNEIPYVNHAYSPLGTVQREEACWVNQSASICAW